MSDTRRDFLLRFAAAALTTTAGAGCEIITEPPAIAVYGPTPIYPEQPKIAIRQGTLDDFIANVGDRVFFDVDSSALRADAKARLAQQAAWLKQFTAHTITVEGHADERGTREHNLALGEKRANAVKVFLIANGVAAARITVVSYGKERPLALGANESAWSQNRRAVTVIGQ
jgi:peptidoglycan-associated lipoprotein